MTYDSGNYEAATAKAIELFGYDELRAEQKRRRDSNDPVQLGIGVSTFTEMCGLAPSRVLGLAQLRRRRLGAREHPDARDRHGRGRHRRLAARPGPRDGVEPDRRRPARRAVRGRRGAARRHPDRARRAWTPTARARSSSGARRSSWPPTRSSRRPRSFAAHLLEASADDLEFSGGRFSVKGTDKGIGHRRGRARDLRRRTTCPTAPSRASTPTRPSTRSTSPSPTAPTCARWRSTPRPARRRCASTSASTTSARSSTRSSSRARCTAASCRASRRRSGRARSTTTRAPSSRAPSSTTPCRPSADTISFVTDHTTSPSTTNTLGTKGVGEAGTIASTPAVVNAIVDAVRHLGVNDVRDAVHARAGVEGDPERRARRSGERDRARPQPHFADDALNQDPAAGARRTERHSDPRSIRLPRPHDRRRGRSRRSPSAATTPRCWPAASPSCPSCGCGSTLPRSSSTSAASRRCAASARTATTSSSAR